MLLYAFVCVSVWWWWCDGVSGRWGQVWVFFDIICQLRSSTQHLILMSVSGRGFGFNGVLDLPSTQGQIKLKKIQISALLVTKRAVCSWVGCC